jgi:hypothetical protein
MHKAFFMIMTVPFKFAQILAQNWGMGRKLGFKLVGCRAPIQFPKLAQGGRTAGRPALRLMVHTIAQFA